MNKILIIVILSLTSIILFGQKNDGYKINISINGLQDSSIYLAYHLGDKQYIKDTIDLDKTGHGIIQGIEILPHGIYMIVFPERKYFEILISDDQYFSINCDYINYFSTLKFTGSEENSAFIEYQKKWMSMQHQAAELSKRAQNNKKNSDSLRIINSEQKAQGDIMKLYLKSVVVSNKDNLLATLVKALLPIDVPEFSIPKDGPDPDSVRWVINYNYNKDHFFDNIDLADERLLRTPILHARLNAFFTNVVIQSADSINKEIDIIIRKSVSNTKIFQFISVFLFNHFRESEIMGHDAVIVKLADDIYLSGKADWVSDEFKEDLRKQVELIRPNLIGNKGENLVMNSYKEIFVSLYDIEKEYTILYFWEPDCGHCIESTPKLKEYYETVKDKNIEIFAVCTTSDKSKWAKYIEENKLTWINGWDPERSSHFDYYYNVQSTPMVYILDRNKKIIAKKLPIEEVGTFINNYSKYFK
jgi:thiol-disulfide isomerase/thioredoxin